MIDFKYEKGFYKYKHSGSLRLKGFVPLDKFVDINNIKYTTEATKSELKDLKLYIHNELVDDNKRFKSLDSYSVLFHTALTFRNQSLLLGLFCNHSVIPAISSSEASAIPVSKAELKALADEPFASYP